jgi:glyoxylase I family protein
VTVFHHVAISCADPLATERYYHDHFGFERARVVALDDGNQIVFVRSGDAYLEIFQADGERPSPPEGGDGAHYPGWRHLAFKVDDIDAKLADMGDAAVVSLGPLDFHAFIHGWRTVWVSDPDGRVVEISQGYVDDDAAPAPPA